jgi:hypothetical protein
MTRIALSPDVAREGDTPVPTADLGSTQFAAIKIDPHECVSRLGRVDAEKDKRLSIFAWPRTAFRKKQGGSQRGMVGHRPRCHPPWARGDGRASRLSIPNVA